MNLLNKDTYDKIYTILVDENKVPNKSYKGNPRINPKYFVEVIFKNYFLGEKVNDLDLNYLKKSGNPNATDPHCQNMAWIKDRFKLRGTKKLIKNISSNFSAKEFENFLIIYMTKTIDKNELLKNSKILSEKVLNDWREYLDTLDIDKSLTNELSGLKMLKNNKDIISMISYENISQEDMEEIYKIQNNRIIDNQTKTYLYKARIGQGKYREDLLDLYENTCMISNINAPELLIASHIVPWVKSNNEEKLDRNNGLLLSASIDKLFDKHNISFDENGFMVISEDFKEKHLDYKDIMSTIGIYEDFIEQRKYLSLSKETKEYMKRHFKELKK